MSFLAPLMLLGGLAAAIPIAVHLIGRMPPRRVPFPSLRFILQSHQRTHRTRKIKHWLLLALRIALPCLLALALARPHLRLAAVHAADSRVRVNAVIVLDCSYSMAYQETDTTRFERARRFALDLLDHFTPDSKIGLVLLADQARRVVPRLTIDHDAVRRGLGDAELIWRGTRYNHGLAAAQELLAADDTPGMDRAIFLIGDLMENGFTGRKLPELAKDIQLFPVDVTRSRSHNGAVLDVEFASTGVTPGMPVVVTARVRPPYPDKDALVTLHIDGRKVSQQLAIAGEDSIRTVRFEFVASAPGEHAGHVRLEEWDALPADNSRPFVFAVGPRPRVLLVGPSGANEKEKEKTARRRNTAWYLRTALAPVTLLSSGLVELTVIESRALAGMILSKFDAAILAGAGDVGEENWRRLEGFVETGGGLIVIPSSPSDAAALAPHAFNAYARAFGLLPGKIHPASPAAAPVGPDLSDLSGPILRAFRGGRNGNLHAVRLAPVIELRPEPKDMLSSVLVKFSDQRALLMEKRFGRGRVLLSAAPFTIAARRPRLAVRGKDQGPNFPHRPAFVPWAHELVRHVISFPGGPKPGRVGRIIEWELPDTIEGKTVQWRRPGNQRWETLAVLTRRVGGAGGRASGDGHFARVEDTNVSGIYRLRYRAAGRMVESLRAVVLDPDESLLKPADEQRLRQLLARPSVQVCRERTELLAALSRSVRTEITGWFWPALLFVLLAECLLANRMASGAHRGAGITGGTSK